MVQAGHLLLILEHQFVVDVAILVLDKDSLCFFLELLEDLLVEAVEHGARLSKDGVFDGCLIVL